jgi:hypothetical protein
MMPSILTVNRLNVHHRDVQRAALGAIVALFIALASLYNVVVPIWEAPEEALHVEYARFLAANRHLPEPRPFGIIPGGEYGGEYYQPPLYYALVALAIAGGRLDTTPEASWHRNPFVTWKNHPAQWAYALHREDEGFPYQGLALLVHVARGISTVLGGILVVGCWGVALALTRSPALALFAVAITATNPAVVYGSARVSNDIAAGAFATLALWASIHLCSHPRRMLMWTVVASLLAAAASLSKLNGMLVFPAVFIGIAFASARDESAASAWGRWRARSGLFAVASVFTAGPVALWWGLHARQYQHIVADQGGMGVANPIGVILSSTPERFFEAVLEWFTTFWGDLGFQSDLPLPIWLYILLGLAMAIAATGLGAGLMSGRWRYLTGDWRLGAGLIALATLVLVVYPTIARQSSATVGLDANARFTFPAQAIIGLLLALGWAWAVPRRWHRAAAPVLIAGLTTIAVATPFVHVNMTHFPTIPARTSLWPEAHPLPISYVGDEVTLVGTSPLPDVLTPGTSLPLSLYWRSLVDGPAEFVAFVQVLDARNERVAGVDQVPAEKTLPVGQWTRYEYVRDERSLELPPNLPPGVYRLRVGAYRFPGPEPIPITSPLAAADGVVDLATLEVPPRRGVVPTTLWPWWGRLDGRS